MFLVNDDKTRILNLNHVNEIYNDNGVICIFMDKDTYKIDYGYKADDVMNMIIKNIGTNNSNILYLPSTNDIDQSTANIVPNDCLYCGRITENDYDSYYFLDKQWYIRKYVDGYFLLNYNYPNISRKINYCPVCGRKLGG